MSRLIKLTGHKRFENRVRFVHLKALDGAVNSDYLRRDYVEEEANGGRWKYSAGFGASALPLV